MTRQINQAGLDLIKRFEGFEARAYLDAVGVPTIGYGHTRTVSADDVNAGRQIDEQTAESLLQEDCDSAQADVERYIDAELNDNQFSALVSFVFNLGGGALRGSTLRRRLNAGDYDAVPSELARWVYAGGRVLNGLVRRRRAEGELFTTQPDSQSADTGMLDVARIVSALDGDDFRPAAYLLDNDVVLERGSVDDAGGARYAHLNQNVPDDYVSQLQGDLKALGFAPDASIDGAFGRLTRGQGGAQMAGRQQAAVTPVRTVHGQRYPELKIIVMSGGARGIDQSHYLEDAEILGADATLSKPFRNRDLTGLIDQLIGPG